MDGHTQTVVVNGLMSRNKLILRGFSKVYIGTDINIFVGGMGSGTECTFNKLFGLHQDEWCS